MRVLLTDLVNKSSTIASAAIQVGQIWKASLTPNDKLDDGTTVYTPEITVVASSN